MTTKRELKKRVRAGINLLNDKIPEWQEKIDVNRLDLRTCHKCILGQIYGDYEDGLIELGIDYSGNSYGFTLSYGEVNHKDEGIADFERLTNTWRDALK